MRPSRRRLAPARVLCAALALGLAPVAGSAQVGSRPLVPLRHQADAEAQDQLDAYRELLRTGGVPLSDTRLILQAMAQRDAMPAAAIGRGADPQGLSAAGKGPIRMLGGDITNTTARWLSIGPFRMQPPVNLLRSTLSGLYEVYALQPENQPNIGPFSVMVSGRINGISFDPSTPGTLYAVAPSGGLWRTRSYLGNPGSAEPDLAVWDTRIDPTSGQPTALTLSDVSFPALHASCVAVHPTNPLILYVGTGDFDGGVSTYAVGIMRSVNGGNTWTNIANGNPLTFPPVASPANTPILEGTSVSGILLDPSDPKIILATSGRAIAGRQGGLWRSEDGGNNWSRPELRSFADPSQSLGLVPLGNWSGIDRNAASDAESRIYYATRLGDGVYRSRDLGKTWVRLPVPLTFNAQPDAGFHLRVAASRLGAVEADALTRVYVIDASTVFNDARVFKSVDAGATWSDITGNIRTIEGGTNDWSLSNRSRVFTSAPGLATSPSQIVQQDVLHTGIFGPVSAFGGIEDSGSFLYGFDRSIVPLWSSSLELDPPAMHTVMHDLALDPANEFFTSYVAAHDGGLNALDYFTATVVGPDAFTPGVFDRGSPQLNGLLNVAQLTVADFAPLDITNGQPPSLKNPPVRVLSGALNNGAPISPYTPDIGASVPVSPNYLKWATVPGGFNMTLDYDSSLPPGADPGTTSNPNGIPNGVDFPTPTGPDIRGALINPFDPDNQYLVVGTGAWQATSGQRILRTINGWLDAADITPDRFLVDDFGNVAVPAGTTPAPPLHVFNKVDAADTTTANNWSGEGKSAVMPLATDGVSLFTGGTFLWRYDPPGSGRYDEWYRAGPGTQPPTPLFDPGPNKDRGVWRRIGTQQLAPSGTISAIAVRVVFGTTFLYVGTTAGDVWLGQYNGTGENGNPQRGTLRAIGNATWRRLAQAGQAGLPALPITSISINESRNENRVADILLTTGGLGTGRGHVFRCQNTLSQNILFTDQSGQGFARLPDVPVYSLARDPKDPSNVLYIGTDLGVFATLNGGATWGNATAPLGLPNVECRNLKVVSSNVNGIDTRFLMVSTFGRGVWQFNLDETPQATQEPKLTMSPTFSRNGNEFFVNLKISNAPTSGTASNVRLENATLQVGSLVLSAYITTPATTISQANPYLIGEIGPGQEKVVTIKFLAAGIRRGSAGIFKAGGRFVIPPYPPGTVRQFNNNPGVRTRLP